MNRLLFLTAVILFLGNISRADFHNNTSFNEEIFSSSPNPTGTFGKGDKISFSTSKPFVKEQNSHREKMFPPTFPPVPSIPLGDFVCSILFSVISGISGYKILGIKTSNDNKNK